MNIVVTEQDGRSLDSWYKSATGKTTRSSPSEILYENRLGLKMAGLVIKLILDLV